jgi:hypothetical protein
VTDEDSTNPKTLAEWVRALLPQSRSQLNARYWRSSAADEEINALCEERNLQRYGRFDPLPDEVQHALHTKLRGARSEEEIWSAAIRALSHPLVPQIAHDLLDRDIAVRALEHSRQTEDVQWRTADFGGVVLLALAVAFY